MFIIFFEITFLLLVTKHPSKFIMTASLESLLIVEGNNPGNSIECIRLWIFYRKGHSKVLKNIFML